MIEEELSIAEFAERFLLTNDFSTPEIYDTSTLNIEVESLNSDGEKEFVPIKNFVVKPAVESYYTDGNMSVTSHHRFVEDGKEIFAKDHPDFIKKDGHMKVVDFEIDSDNHTYLANGRLNHNTTSGGKAVAFASSVRLRLKSIGQIKAKIHNVDQVVGIKTRALVQKNRMGPPLKQVDYEIYFKSGIDNYGSWLEVLKKYGMASSGTMWTFKTSYESHKEVDASGKPKMIEYSGELINPNSGEIKKIVDGKWKIRSKVFSDHMEANPELRDFYYGFICDRLIMTYQVNKDFSKDDVIIDDNVIDENG